MCSSDSPMYRERRHVTQFYSTLFRRQLEMPIYMYVMQDTLRSHIHIKSINIDRYFVDALFQIRTTLRRHKWDGWMYTVAFNVVVVTPPTQHTRIIRTQHGMHCTFLLGYILLNTGTGITILVKAGVYHLTDQSKCFSGEFFQVWKININIHNTCCVQKCYDMHVMYYA